MFVDKVRLVLCAGKGGNGIVAWIRARFIPKGGPCGGDGGKGGSIFLEASSDTQSLESFRNSRIIRAKNGGEGGKNLKKGKKRRRYCFKGSCWDGCEKNRNQGDFF